ncbi:MAG TPA: hypothetical protein VF077_12315 [Nitrospiraceae bacterium]
MAIDYRYTAKSAQKEIDRLLHEIQTHVQLMEQATSEEDLRETQGNLWQIAKAAKERCRPRRNLTILEYIIADVKQDLQREANMTIETF